MPSFLLAALSCCALFIPQSRALAAAFELDRVPQAAIVHPDSIQSDHSLTTDSQLDRIFVLNFSGFWMCGDRRCVADPLVEPEEGLELDSRTSNGVLTELDAQILDLFLTKEIRRSSVASLFSDF